MGDDCKIMNVSQVLSVCQRMQRFTKIRSITRRRDWGVSVQYSAAIAQYLHEE